MHLAVTQPFSPNRQHLEDSDEQNRIAMLKAQNKMLTQVSFRILLILLTEVEIQMSSSQREQEARLK